jgi:hypothetical protein
MNENAFYVDPYTRYGNRSFMFDLIGIQPIAIGTIEQPIDQPDCAIAIGQHAGYWKQGTCAIAIGEYAGHTFQGPDSIALGSDAGNYYQGTNAIAIGIESGSFTQGQSAIAIGEGAGKINQGTNAIAIGKQAGSSNQAQNSIVLNASGSSFAATQSSFYVNPIRLATSGQILYYNDVTKEVTTGGVPTGSIPVGTQHGDYLHWDRVLGSWSLGTESISLGSFAGENDQSLNGVAIGFHSGESSQRGYAVAIGSYAGSSGQGTNAIAIGRYAGTTSQHANSILLNASGTYLNSAVNDACYISPIRNTSGPQALFYTPSSKEITYAAPTFTNVSLQTYTYSYFQSRNAVLGKFMLTDCADKDAFYRLRISEPVTLFEGNTIYDSSSIFFDNDITANASITGPGSLAAMTLTVNAGSVQHQYAARQSHYYAHYQPGKSFLAMFSFSMGSPVNGIVKRVGLYDVDNATANQPLNGVLFEQTDTGGYRWVIHKGDGNTQSALQASWNVDPLNGSGPSGETLNLTENLLGFVDLEWLGVGRVRVGFYIRGVPVICHAFNNTGFTVPYLNNPYLPIRYEVRRAINSATNAGSMTAICCTIISEGGYEPIGIIRSFQSGQLSLSAVDIKYCLAIRLRSTYPRGMLQPVSVEIVSDLTGGANIAYYSVYLWRPSSATVPSSTTWNNVSGVLGGSGSCVEYSNPGQSGVTDLYNQMLSDSAGISLLIERGSVNSTSKTSFSFVISALPVAQSNVDRQNRDIYLVVINNNSTGNGVKYTALFTWREI